MYEKRVDYLIVGGGLAGGNAYLSIKQQDREGKVLMVSEERYFPYDRVPLSKEYLLGKITEDQLYISSDFDPNEIELERKVTQLDLGNRTAKLDNNIRVGFKKLLLATGGKVKKLKTELKGIYYLRTLDDAKLIKSKISSSENIIIVGGGFIGCELASVLSVKGFRVTVIEMLDNLLGAVLDKDIASWFTNYFSDMGVNLKLNTKITKFIGNENAIGVETDRGELIKGDLIIAAIGISPNDDIAQNAGLKVNNGIIVNDYLETDVKGIYAAGDVARFYSPIYNEQMRIEHYDVAVKQGKIAGENMAGGNKQFNEIPYFFSRMFDAKLIVKVYGVINKYDKVVQRGPDGKGSIIRFYLKNGLINGIMLINASARESTIKKLIGNKSIDEEKLKNSNIKLEEIAS